MIEIRSYKLKPGTGAMFHSLVSETSIPLMQAAGMIVVAYGQSLHDPDHQDLMRAYDSLEQLQASQEVFYSSSAWRMGPREQIIALIESDSNTTLWLPNAALGRNGDFRDD
ncbi:MAG: NIPSNAP family protein [Betaproteobacteria bacterium]